MTFKTAYCTDTTCRSIRIIQNNGNTIFSIPSPTDPTYLNLLLYAEVPYSYVPVSQFYCDASLLTRGKILTTNEFITQCDTTTGDLLLTPPTTNYDWAAAHTLINSNDIIAYTYNNEKFTLDPVDDIVLYNEVSNYSNFLFGGKILNEYEANLYNIADRYFNFPDIDENEVEYITYDIDELAPFTLTDIEEGTQVDSGFFDFLQLSDTIVNQYYNNFNPVSPPVPPLLRDVSLARLWLRWYNSTTIPEFTLIKTKLEKDIDS
ncbi:MAG: hypothetical protein R3321_00180 [Nitrososphaeraceae archaeon]|nr:hypothetical protein [Nitrososphaeraceae archaeon]